MKSGIPFWHEPDKSMKPELPPAFTQTIRNTFGEDGKRWLKAFSALLEEATQRWNLTDIQPVPNLSYNFVALANQNMNREVAMDSKKTFKESLRSLNLRGENTAILKLGVPNRELTSEIAALRLYNGCGACRLLHADVDKGMLLLERLQPGHMLASVVDDEHATRIAAEVMSQLWQSSSGYETTKVFTTDFIQLKDWFDVFTRLGQRYHGTMGPLPKHLVEAAESISTELLAENKAETLLHGDFHHFNVLESERGWLAIDPKGVIGPKGYEVGPFLINPNDSLLTGSDPIGQTEKRIAILSEMLGMERERIRSWAICHAVLSARWGLEDGEDWRYAIRCAEIFTIMQK